MKNDSKLLYQNEQIRNLEKAAIKEFNLSVENLMERAGTAAWRELITYWPKAKNITVVCGKGNNGGDGYVLARLAHEAGLNVLILQLAAQSELTGAALNAASACSKLNIKLEKFNPDKFPKCDVIVDAIFGTGLNGQPEQSWLQAIEVINGSKIPVLAIDVPSGLEANSGNVLGLAIKATVTVTFISKKIGLFTGEGREYCGEIICDDLDLPKEIFKQINPCAEILDFSSLKKALLPRRKVAHKGDFGHVLVCGGDIGMAGAVRMAAEAAARVGAGLVSVVTRPEHVTAINIARPEIMCYGVDKLLQLQSLLKKAAIIVIGPGLGQSLWGKKIFQAAITSDKTMVIDADGLNILASHNLRRANWVLTPHPGEAARLLKTTNKVVQNDRLKAVNALQKKYGGVCVLKGAGTLISDGGMVGLCDAGNPGMASGGMGDVLCGIIGGLMAQGLSVKDAAKLGVYLHAKAGDLAAKESGERGLLALDLLPYIRKLMI